MRSRLLQGFLTGLAACAAALALLAAGALDWLEDPLWAWRVRALAAPRPSTDRIVLVLLDQDSLDWGADPARAWSWPWPRETYAAMLDFARRGGAKGFTFDVLFTEPSPWGVADDAALGEALARTPGSAAALLLAREQGAKGGWPPAIAGETLRLPGLAAQLPPALAAGLTLPRAVLPIGEVAAGAAALGNVGAGTVREAALSRLPPLAVHDGRAVPALGLAAYLAAEPRARVRLGDGALLVDGRRIPLDARGRAILRFRGPPGTHRAVNAAAVLESELLLREGRPPRLDPQIFRDRYVFLGFSAPGLVDLRPTPVSPDQPGVEIHATFLDNLLAGDFVREAPPAATALLTLLLALAAAVLGRLCRTAAQSALSFLLLPAPALLGLAAYRAGLWLPAAPPLAATALALVGALAVNYAAEGRQRRLTREAFRQYLSPHVIEELLRHPERLRLGGETRELTIFFSDLAGFTTLSEGLAPEQLTALLNEYLTEMTDLILDAGGTVDKYEGDAIIAFWNAPLEVPDHALAAVRTALRCQERLAAIRPDLAARYGRELHCRIGLNTGAVVVGNMGSRRRFDYTFLGDAGNLASRLEGVNKQFGTPILISEATRERLGGRIPAREIGRVRVVGRREPVRIFEPLAPEQLPAREPAWRVFAEGLAAYARGDFSAARALFERTAAEDPPARAYAAACRRLAQEPPAAWDGVWEVREK